MTNDLQTKKMWNVLLVVIILVLAYLFWQRLFLNEEANQSESQYNQAYEDAANSVEPIENESDLDRAIELLDETDIDGLDEDIDNLDEEVSGL